MKLYQNRDWLYQKYIVEKLSTPKIAKIVNVSRSTIWRALYRKNLSVRSFSEGIHLSKYNPLINKYQDKEWLYKKYVIEKKTLTQIGEICKVDFRDIHYWLKKYDIPRRSRRIDLTGQRFGRLIAIKRVGFDKWKQALWLCKCDCGTEKIIKASSLRSDVTKSCGCINREKQRLGFGIGNMRTLFAHYKKSARKRGYIFELTEKQFAEITKKDCHYCGAKPNQVTKRYGAFGDYIYNGIDRKDNEKGYTIDNVVPCCKMCNMAKNNHKLQEFKDWIEKAYNKMFLKEIRNGKFEIKIV